MVNNENTNFIFPVIEEVDDPSEKEIVRIFSQRYRDILFMREEQKVLQAIEKASDLTGNAPELIAKILVDKGLRVDRRALPQEFLDYIDNIFLNTRDDITTIIPRPLRELKKFWCEEGIEDCMCDRAGVCKQDYASFLNL